MLSSPMTSSSVLPFCSASSNTRFGGPGASSPPYNQLQSRQPG